MPFPDDAADTTLTATALLDKARSMPFSEEERGVLREALAVARETEDEDAEFLALVALCDSLGNAEENAEFLTHFATAVALHDRDPQRFPGLGDGTGTNLFWQYKHAAHTIATSCAFPRSQADAVLDSMEAHFRAAGAPETSIDIARRDDAVVNGDVETALAIQSKIDASGGHDLDNDCPTCQLDGLFDLAIRAGDIQAAHGCLMKILDYGRTSCPIQPEMVLSDFMLIALRHGDTDFAAYAQRTSAAANPRFQSIDSVGRHMEFLGITGNYTRGLGLLERYQRDLLADPLGTFDHFGFFSGALVLLTATDRAGFGDVVVSGSGAPELAPFYGPRDAPGTDAGTDAGADAAGRTDFTVRELMERSAAAATDLARRYDERNGNDNFARRMADIEEHRSLDIPLNLGSTNLLLRAETTTPDPTPPTGAALLDRLNLALYTDAVSTAIRLATNPADLAGPDLLAFLGKRVTLCHVADDAAGRHAAYVDYLAEMDAQNRADAPFLRTLTSEEFMNPAPEDFQAWRDEADRLLRAASTDGADHDVFDSWVSIASHLFAAMMTRAGTSEDPAEGFREAHNLLRSIVDEIRSTGRLREFGMSAVNLFNLDLANGRLADPTAAYTALREEISWPQTVELDMVFAEAASRHGVEDGWEVTDRLLASLIDLGEREVTAQVALGTVTQLARGGRFAEAAERARLAVRECEAAGLPTRIAALREGEMLVYADADAEGREILEPLLLPTLQSPDSAESVGTVELDALYTLGLALKNTDTTPDAATLTLLRTRDLAMEAGNPQLAVSAVNAYTDMAHALGRYGSAVEELTRTLPAAEQIADDRWSVLRLRDRIAVNQMEAGDTSALDTLAEAMAGTRDLNQRVYVRESVNRALHSFGRLDECLAGCETVADWILHGDGDEQWDIRDSTEPRADLAAGQLFHGAQYAVWSEDLPAAVTMLEETVQLPGVSPQTRVNHYRTLAQLTGELGRTDDADRWQRRADELAQTLTEETGRTADA